MENNASSAGVSLGGLFNTADIKILICYILSAVDRPVPVNMLANVLHFEGIANAFEVSDAVISLANSGQIVQESKEDDTYIITASGRDIAATLKTSLSFTVRDRAYTAALKMLSRFQNSKETAFEITRENESTYITCSALDGDKPFLSVKLLVSDEAQAQCIKEKFLASSSDIYSEIIELLTKH